MKGCSAPLLYWRSTEAANRAPAFLEIPHVVAITRCVIPERARAVTCPWIIHHYRCNTLPLSQRVTYWATMVLAIKFMPSKAPRSQTITPPTISLTEPEAYLVVPAKLDDTFASIRKRAIGRFQKQEKEYFSRCSDEYFSSLCTEKGATLDSEDTLADYYTAKNLQDDITLLLYRVTPPNNVQGLAQTTPFNQLNGLVTPTLTRKRKHDEAVAGEAGSNDPDPAVANHTQQDASAHRNISSESDEEWPVARGDWTMKERRNLLAGVQQGLTIELALKRYRIRRTPASARAQIKMLGQSKVVSREVMARRPSGKKRPRYSSCTCGRLSQSEHRAKSPVVLIRSTPRRSSITPSTTTRITYGTDKSVSNTIDDDRSDDLNTEVLIAAQLGVDITQSVGDDRKNGNNERDERLEPEDHGIVGDGQNYKDDGDDDQVWATPGTKGTQHQLIRSLAPPLKHQRRVDMSNVSVKSALPQTIPASSHERNATEGEQQDFVGPCVKESEATDANVTQSHILPPASPPAGHIRRPLRFLKLEQARNKYLRQAQNAQAKIFTASPTQHMQRQTGMSRIRPDTPNSSTDNSIATRGNIQRIMLPEKFPAHLDDAKLWTFAQKAVLNPSDAEWYYVYLKWIRTTLRGGPEIDIVALNDDYTRKRHAFERARGLRAPKQPKQSKPGRMQRYGLPVDVDDGGGYASDLSELTDIEDRIHFPIELLHGSQSNIIASERDSDCGDD